MALSNKTQDHDVIREWAEKRGAKPAEVASTERKGQTGILRLEFPGAPHAKDSALKEISWDEFFEKFDGSGLEFIFQERTADGEQSNFNKLIYPEDENTTLKKTASKKTAAKKSASKGAASKTAAKKTPATKTPATKAPAKKTAAKKSAPSKSTAKKAPSKSASKKTQSSTPARNFPKPEHGGHTQVF